MSEQDFSTRERQIFYYGKKEGKKEGNILAGYLFLAFILSFGMLLLEIYSHKK